MTDNKYHKSKIYTIRSYQTDKYYIGSTCDALHKRLFRHRRNYKSYLDNKYNFVSSFDIILYEDNYIELLEDYKCENRNELTKREGELIRKYKDEIVNCKIEGRTQKEYYEDNKDKIKEYYEDNKEKIKEYYEDNKTKIKEYSKEYRTKLYDCECGKSQLVLAKKSRHNKSKFHLDNI
jgi:hypothetical protein